MTHQWPLIASACLLALTRAAVPQYGLQFDAGSQGTRIHIYKWNKRVFSTLPPGMTEVGTKASWEKKIRPGLSSYTDNPAGAGESLTELIKFASEVLTTNGVTKFQDVPVFLGATAGMRMVDPVKASQIMTSVRSKLKDSGFMYRSEWVRIISGEEEGAFGWITTNSLTKTLRSSGQDTVGALDLGGASTQITFHPDSEINAGYFPMQIADIVHDIYTHSYLYFGQEEAFINYQKLLDSKSDPCLPKGYENSGYTGQSDWIQCLNHTKNLFDSCDAPGTSVYQPNIQPSMVFYAFSGFYYTWNHFMLKTGINQSSDLNSLLSVAKQVCNQNLTQQEAFNPKEPKEYVPFYCFRAAYSYLLLTHYGLPTANTPIRVVSEIDNNDVGWTYGAMLWQINRLSWSYDSGTNLVNQSFEVPFYAAVIIAGLLLLALTIVMGVGIGATTGALKLFKKYDSVKKTSEMTTGLIKHDEDEEV